MMSFRIIITTLLIAHCAKVQGLLCYECLNVGPDSKCLHDPGFEDLKHCENAHYCVIKRTENSEGVVLSTARGCAWGTPVINETDTHDGLVIHNTACTTDLCNSGDGSPKHWYSGLQCYSCWANGDEEQQSDCVLNPERNVDFIDKCKVGYDYCAISITHLGGKFKTLARGCAEAEKEIYKIQTTMKGTLHQVEHIMTCKERLCNGGNPEEEATWMAGLQARPREDSDSPSANHGRPMSDQTISATGVGRSGEQRDRKEGVLGKKEEL